jgi:LmbE family N-acetylglucosaminyl deacetylase
MSPVPGLGTILGVWAHPDDEAYLSAGLMTLARQAGQRVVVVTATAGELGTDDPAWRATRAMADQRSHELADSLAVLGVEEHHLLGVADGRCDQIPARAGARYIGRWIEEVEPDTIVTFGPEGMTGHPDHIAVHQWTTDAWRAAGARARLLYATVTPEFHERWGAVNDALGLWEGDVPCTPADRIAVSVDSRPVLDRKVAALHAHASQVGPIIAALGADAFREWWATETFAEAVAS